MKTFLNVALPTPATVLALGLLGLLLWGQCAFHLNDGGGSSQPPPPDLHLNIAVGTARLDSFSTRGLEHGYVSVTLQNRSERPCRLANVDCGLYFDKQLKGFNVSRTAYRTLLPAHSERIFSLDLTPFKVIDYKKGPDFKLLRAAWQEGKLAKYHAELNVHYSYYPADDSATQHRNSRVKNVPLIR